MRACAALYEQSLNKALVAFMNDELGRVIVFYVWIDGYASSDGGEPCSYFAG